MSLPYMPMYWGDYWRDTGHLSDGEHVAYLKLISHYWQHGSLPAEDARLARIAGRTPDEWKDMRETLATFFKDGWTHPRIDRELAKNVAVRQSNSEKAKNAANARWNASSIRDASVEECSANAIQNQNHNHNHIQNQKSKSSVDRPRGARLATDWQPSDEDVSFAKQLGVDWQGEAEKFRDYWTALAGPKAAKLDWSATWRNWIRNAGKAPQQARKQDSPLEITKRMMRELDDEQASRDTSRGNNLLGLWPDQS